MADGFADGHNRVTMNVLQTSEIPCALTNDDVALAQLSRRPSLHSMRVQRQGARNVVEDRYGSPNSSAVRFTIGASAEVDVADIWK